MFFIDVSEKEEYIFKQYLIMIIEICILKVKKIYMYLLSLKVYGFLCVIQRMQNERV